MATSNENSSYIPLFVDAATIHGINDVWIYPSQECDEDIGATLISYSSPAVYVFTEADAGKVIFFVNSVGIRCQSGVSLYATVSDKVLSQGSSNGTIAAGTNDTMTTPDADILIEVNETLVNDTVEETVFDIGGDNTIAIGVQTPDSRAPESDELLDSSSCRRYLVSSLLQMVAITSSPFVLMMVLI